MSRPRPKSNVPPTDEKAELFPNQARRATPIAERAPATDVMVLTSGEELVPFNRSRIADELAQEGLDAARAEAVAARVEEQLRRAQLGAVSTAVVRELVGAELFTLGITPQRWLTARYGLSRSTVRNIVFGLSDEPAARALEPQQTSLALARRIKRQHALSDVYTDAVATAHVRGDLHIHDLDATDRPESLSFTLEGLQRTGRPVPGEAGAPAASVEQLFAQTARLVASLRRHVSGAVCIEALNVSLAPYVQGRSPDELIAVAQQFLAELDYATLGAVTDAAPATEVRLYWDLPPALAGSSAVGPGGEPAGCYGDHAGTARQLTTAFLAACDRGSVGQTPDLVLVIGADFFHTPGHLAALEAALASAARHGRPRLRFERRAGEDRFSERAAQFGAEAGPRRLGAPHRVCLSAVLASVSIGLPRIGYEVGNDEESLEARLLARLDLAAQAHIQKRVFLEQLMARGTQGPLGFLIDRDGDGPILAVDSSVHRVLACGLNELAEVVIGAPLHAAPEAVEFASRFLERMRRQVDSLSRKHKLLFRLGGEPLTDPARRFAKLDISHLSAVAGPHVKGDLSHGGVLYTPGVSVEPDADLPLLERLTAEGKLHRSAPWDAASDISARSLGRPAEAAKQIMEVYRRTECREIRIVP